MLSLQSLSLLPCAATWCFCGSQALCCLGTLPVPSLGQPGKLPRHNLGGVSRQWELASWFHHPLAVWLWASHLTSLVTSLSVSSDTD